MPHAERGPAEPGLRRDPETGLVQVPFKDWLADPHGTFRAARGMGPLMGFASGLGVLAIRAPDVIALTTDQRVRQIGTEGLEMAGIRSGPFHRFASKTLLLAHGETHVRRRRAVAKTFNYKLMEAMRGTVRAEAEAMAAALPDAGPFDLRDAFAAVLPARVIAGILGLPEADIPTFTAKVYAMSRGLAFSVLPEEWPAIDHGAAALTSYVAGLLAERRARPRADVLTAYVRQVDGSGDLDGDEVLAQIVSLILAGADTTRGAMTILVELLLAHPEQWRAVVEDPALVPGAVAEALRFEPVVGSLGVIPTETVEIGGIAVPRGIPLGLSTMSAMRDPDLYADPDRFDIARTDHPRLHLVFGGGPHRCLGEALARVELEEGLRALATRFPALRRAGPPLRVSGVGGIRQVGRMQVEGA